MIRLPFSNVRAGDFCYKNNSAVTSRVTALLFGANIGVFLLMHKILTFFLSKNTAKTS